MTGSEIIEFAKFGINMNSSQLADDVSDARWLQLLNMAYKNLWSRFRTQVSRASLLSRSNQEWAIGSPNFTLPNNLQNSLIYALYSVNADGTLLAPLSASFISRNVLVASQFASTSITGQTYPFALFFIPDVEDLTLNSIPTLIPPVHHEVIAWELMRVVKMLLDKEVPESWVEHIEGVEFQLISEWKTRPMADRPNIVSLDVAMYRPMVA